MLFTPRILASHKSTSFAVLLWQELFDESAPDTFQPKLQNIPALVVEIQNVASLALENQAWRKHLEEIKEELKDRLVEDAVLLKAFPKYEWSLADLLKSTEPRQLQIRAKLLVENEPAFEQFYARNLERAINGMPREKQNFVTALGNLASLATQTGSRRQALRILADASSLDLPCTDVLDAVCRGCKPGIFQYQFIAAIAGDPADVQAVIRTLEQVRLLAKRNRPSGTDAQNFFEALPRATFVAGTVEGNGPVTAAKIVTRRMRSITDTFNFYSNSLKLTPCDQVLLVSDRRGVERVDLAEQSLRRLSPRKDARVFSLNTLRALLGNRLDGGLLNALELHSLAHSSGAGRVRLVNLWSAVECLISPRDENSIIERVASIVVPITVWRRVEKVVHYLAICTHLQRSFSRRPFAYEAGFQNSDKHSIRPEDLLHVLAKPNGHPHPRALSDYVADHPLLRYRLFRAWQALSNPAELRKELAASERRVRWQVFRIYRARNLTVHQGDHGPHITSLLDTLQYYFSVVLTRILHELSAHPDWQVDDAVSYLLREARYTRDLLEQSSSKILTKHFMVDPQCREDEALWP